MILSHSLSYSHSRKREEKNVIEGNKILISSSFIFFSLIFFPNTFPIIHCREGEWNIFFPSSFIMIKHFDPKTYARRQYSSYRKEKRKKRSLTKDDDDDDDDVKKKKELLIILNFSLTINSFILLPITLCFFSLF